MQSDLVKPRARILRTDHRGNQSVLVTDRLGSFIYRSGWRPPKRCLVKDWRDEIRIGDVLIERTGGACRVVRSCSYREGGWLAVVDLLIQRCSWTGACYTVVTRSDLKTRGFFKAGIRVRLDTEFDEKVFRDIEHHTFNKRRALSCCDVRGIA